MEYLINYVIPLILLLYNLSKLYIKYLNSVTKYIFFRNSLFNIILILLSVYILLNKLRYIEIILILAIILIIDAISITKDNRANYNLSTLQIIFLAILPIFEIIIGLTLFIIYFFYIK